jgi:hypothetical protein
MYIYMYTCDFLFNTFIFETDLRSDYSDLNPAVKTNNTKTRKIYQIYKNTKPHLAWLAWCRRPCQRTTSCRTSHESPDSRTPGIGFKKLWIKFLPQVMDKFLPPQNNRQHFFDLIGIFHSQNTAALC